MIAFYAIIRSENNSMNATHSKTLQLVFKTPVSSTIAWRQIESMLIALGAQVIEGNGSRVRFVLNDVVATFHRPHPHKEAKPYQVKDAKAFLIQAGYNAEGAQP